MAGWGSPRRKGTDRQSCRSGPEHRSELSPIPRLTLCDSRAGGKVRVPPDSGSDGGTQCPSVRPLWGAGAIRPVPPEGTLRGVIARYRHSRHVPASPARGASFAPRLLSAGNLFPSGRARLITAVK
jgi:hypothetical protein